MESIGWPELLVIGIVFIVLFGANKIPDAAKGLGEAIRNFKSAVKSGSEAVQNEAAEVQKEIEKV
jgi:sec-independent protein translocase protein TatA